MGSIPEEYHDLFEKETFAHVATLTDDGLPHVTPVWIDYDADGGHLLVNTERDRQKTRNAEHNSGVGVSMTDPDDPYRRLSVIGEIDEITTEGARDHIDELARRYTDADEYQNPIQSERVLFRIRVEEVF
ncbi:PPOX class F420-dependent oxidoreductase [Natrinema halophilum]|uniref:PPOX class F420-dependent oxidoreductase n=1 Tax=Natrinema halophilum TaxID=1699371 RepID=A0A7D5H9P3_9EURY|nr:PPOX class F420-dependent oxidoreductase [Natrinema halophilum]QLG50335.1 PPOX class F420-dependent oxidoreductase [Natrinema halophilum]